MRLASAQKETEPPYLNPHLVVAVSQGVEPRFQRSERRVLPIDEETLLPDLWLWRAQLSILAALVARNALASGLSDAEPIALALGFIALVLPILLGTASLLGSFGIRHSCLLVV
jgi:hypothetical protein